MTGTRDQVHLPEVVPLAVGLLALLVATAFGWDSSLVAFVVSPPLVVRIALTGVALITAIVLLGAAVARMEGRPGAGGHLVTLLRGIRLAFLALATLSIALGWALGSALPFVVAMVIAGIDIVETSFLLIVVRREGR